MVVANCLPPRDKDRPVWFLPIERSFQVGSCSVDLDREVHGGFFNSPCKGAQHFTLCTRHERLTGCHFVPRPCHSSVRSRKALAIRSAEASSRKPFSQASTTRA